MGNPLDTLYASHIKKLVSIIGKKAAYEILLKEARNRFEAMQKQVVSIEGAFANEIAGIFEEYPGYSLKFSDQSETGFTVVARTVEKKMTQDEWSARLKELESRIQEVFERHNKLECANLRLSSSVKQAVIVEDEE